MLQNPRKTLGLKKIMVYKIPPGGGKPYPASGLVSELQKRSGKEVQPWNGQSYILLEDLNWFRGANLYILAILVHLRLSAYSIQRMERTL